MVHHAVRLFGLPKSVSNSLFYERENAIADDHFEMILKYDESFNVLLGSKQLERSIKPKLEVVGLNGTYSQIARILCLIQTTKKIILKVFLLVMI